MRNSYEKLTKSQLVYFGRRCEDFCEDFTKSHKKLCKLCPS